MLEGKLVANVHDPVVGSDVYANDRLPPTIQYDPFHARAFMPGEVLVNPLEG